MTILTDCCEILTAAIRFLARRGDVPAPAHSSADLHAALLDAGRAVDALDQTGGAHFEAETGRPHWHVDYANGIMTYVISPDALRAVCAPAAGA
ncbi:hypothetical protein CKO28_25340 [Rhodovibrio sodomensis]|uniref:Uncharacterized protein n=1 Tax=Rhodovibrio sodomensis TaxID=1088 RepID=A0ABS1DNQ4_9PROT|nr:hypothetical protein [Rhodovibrio sodomensis]MBK1671329.1 hypothetical protein [Rhodovibrio sodomensis]